MKSTIALLSLAVVAAATPDPQITPRAQLEKRQADPALLGYVSKSGEKSFSDARSCDYPATLSSAGSFAQCCSGSDCVFWSSCSAGTLFAQSTSLRCDQGFCNTAVLVATPGATSGKSYLGCWATDLGQDAFTIVKDVGGAIATRTASESAVPSNTSSARSTSASVRSSASGSAVSSGTARATAQSSTVAAQSSTAAAQSSGAAVANAARPFTGAFGLVAVLFGIF